MTITTCKTAFQRRHWRTPLGRVYFSAGTLLVRRSALMNAVARHTRGDWGLVTFDDWEHNEDARMFGGEFFSAYRDRDRWFCIRTTADRSLTLVQLALEL